MVRKILEVCKQFAENHVNEKGNVPRRGVVPTFSDIEVIAFSFTAEAFSVDSENYLFTRLQKECINAIPYLISRRKRTGAFGEDIHQQIVKTVDGGESVFSIDFKPVKVCQNARAGRCAIGRSPAWRYCASQKMRYYGYKLHTFGISGVIHFYNMTATSVHNLHYPKDVKRESTIMGE